MSEWATYDEMTAAILNQKSVYVGSVAPGTPYEGQHWIDTTTDPSLLKIYDLTNTAWVEYRPVYYETPTGAWADPTQTPVINGTLVIMYNSTQVGSRLYGYSNGAWVNFSGVLVRASPAGDDSDSNEGTQPVQAINLSWNSSGLILTGADYALLTLNSTPTANDATICAFAGGGYIWEGTSATLKLYIDSVLVDSVACPITVATSPTALKGFADGKTNAATTVELLITNNDGGSDTLRWVGATLAAISVIT